MQSPQHNKILVENYPTTQSLMRIAVVTETWPPEVNGVALTLSKLVHGLALKNHAIQLIRPRQGTQDTGMLNQDMSELLLKGLPIPRYPDLKLGLPNKNALLKAWSLKRPDLVHIATEGPLGWSALKVARQLRLPVTSDFRTNFHSYSKHYGVGWLSKPILAYLRKFHNRTSCTMVPTRALRNELSALGFENVRVVARGVDTSVFHPDKRRAALRQEWGVSDNSLVMLSVGRLAKEKNLDLVIKAHQAMLAAHPACRLVFAGDGPYRATLQEKCPDAIFLGMCSHAELAHVYASADLFVFPSLTETFGNVTLEALASGTPTLAFDTAAAAEHIVSGQNGWLVQGASEDDFVAQALRLAQAPEVPMGLRDKARQSAAALDWHAIVAQVEAMFLKALRDTAPIDQAA